MKRFCCSGTSKKNEDDLKTAKRLKIGPGHYRNFEVTVGIKQRWKWKPCNIHRIHLFQSPPEKDSFQCLPAGWFQVPAKDVCSWFCWKFCFLCFCLPVCYPCYLTRTFRRRNVRGPGLNFKYQQSQIKRISPEKKTRESEIRLGLLKGM